MKRSRLLPDFVFLDDRGSARSFRDVLGDFTVLAVTHCGKTTHGPACESLTAMVAENRGVNGVDVRGIEIRWMDAPCEKHDACHVVDVQPNTLTLCDGTGTIRRLFGVEQEDRFFVIGPDRYLMDSATAHDVDPLRVQLNLAVALCHCRAARNRPRSPSFGRAVGLPPDARQETGGVPLACGGALGVPACP